METIEGEQIRTWLEKCSIVAVVLDYKFSSTDQRRVGSSQEPA